MAKWGIAGSPIPTNMGLPYVAQIQKAAQDTQASPCALYAIAWRETLAVERSGWLKSVYNCNACDVITPDGGHGIFQVTDSFPENWQDPYENAVYASNNFYDPYLKRWIARNYNGITLLRLAADDYNAGDSAVWAAHTAGNADAATTGCNYGSDVAIIFANLLSGRDPDIGRPS